MGTLLFLLVSSVWAAEGGPVEIGHSAWSVSTPPGYSLRPEAGAERTWKREKPWDSPLETKDEEMRRDLLLGPSGECERSWNLYCRSPESRIEGLSQAKHLGRPAWRYECRQGLKRSYQFAVQAEFGYCLLARTAPCRTDVDAKVCDERRVAWEKLIKSLKPAPGSAQPGSKPKPAKRKFRPVVR